jgi:multidrug resistance efflux pump
MGDYRTTTGEALPVAPIVRKRRKYRIMIGIMAAVLAVIAAAILVRVDQVVPASGYVTTEEYAEIRSPVTGTVADIFAFSNQEVTNGTVLVRLEDTEERATRDEAESRLRKIDAQLVRRQAEILEERRQREAQAEVARLRVEHAASRVRVTAELAEKGLAAGRALDDEKLREQVAAAELAALLGHDESLSEKELDILRREREAAEDALSRAEARVRQRQIRAPLDGRLHRYGFVVGELVRPETVLYEVFGGDKWILKLRVPERHATLIRPGQSYEAELVPYKGLHRIRFTGIVEKLRGVIQAENQKTYRVAYCSFAAGAHEVPPGTTAEATITVGSVPLWVRLFGLY